MGTEKKEGLGVKELLTRVYEGIKEKYPYKAVDFKTKAYVEIADDSDWHRTRKGYMLYESVTILKVGKKFWAICLGKETQGYPADSYSCDISAIEVDSEEIAEENLVSIIEASNGLKNSLMSGMADGNLIGTKANSLSEKLVKLVSPKISDFIARELEFDMEHFHLDLRPVVKSSMLFKESFVGFLVDSIVQVFSDNLFASKE